MCHYLLVLSTSDIAWHRVRSDYHTQLFTCSVIKINKLTFHTPPLNLRLISWIIMYEFLDTSILPLILWKFCDGLQFKIAMRDLTTLKILDVDKLVYTYVAIG